MMRLFLAGATLVSLGAAAPATAQVWRDIPCAESRLQVSGTLKCQIQAPLVSTNDGREIPTSYAAAGTINGVEVSFRLSVTKPPAHFRAYPEQEAVRTIRGFSTEIMGSGITDWAGPSAQRALVFMTFRAKDRGCVGFDLPGAPHSAGAPAHMHAWILRGVICPPNGQPVNRRAIVRYLEAVKVNVQDTPNNVLGTEVQPWP